MARDAYINRIETSVPPHDVHAKFVEFAPALLSREIDRAIFRRMAHRCQIDHRYSFLEPHGDERRLDTGDFYRLEDFPHSGARMDRYRRDAFMLAKNALDKMSGDLNGVTHLIVTSCTGFYAPGIDFDIIDHYKLEPTIERTIIGFMGCNAAINALKIARHVVRSEASAKILIVNIELCTLHLQDDVTLEKIIPFLLFADGCAAALVSSEPGGIELQSFASYAPADAPDDITWDIGALGFKMNLSGRVPSIIGEALPDYLLTALGGHQSRDIDHWAVHPGGRTILDAVRDAAHLEEAQLSASRDVLRRHGNMSSATIMFVLKQMFARNGTGCALAFGPGVSIESMNFAVAGHA